MQALNADGYDMTGGKSAVGASKADGLDSRNATEKTAITFKALAAGEWVEIGGLKLTATAGGAGLSADKVAKVFSGIDSTTTLAALNALTTELGAANVNGTFSSADGTKAFASTVKYTSPAYSTGATSVTFTSTEALKSVTDLAINTSAADVGIEKKVVTQGVAADGASTLQANESAYGDAVLYWNDNGTAKAINIDTVANSEFAIDQLDKAILGVATERAKYGAFMSRLEHSSDNLLNVAQNTDQSRSRIEDADYAVETSELARTQIISQASTAMLAQANQSKQSVLTLLQG
jgi:flagellin